MKFKRRIKFLTEDEIEFLEIYNQLSDTNKETIMGHIRFLKDVQEMLNNIFADLRNINNRGKSNGQQ